MLKIVLILLISIAPVLSSGKGYSDKLRESVFGTQKTKEEQYQARRYAVLAPLLKESQLEQAAQLEQQEQLRQQKQLEQKRQLELQAQFEQKTKRCGSIIFTSARIERNRHEKNKRSFRRQ